MCCVRSDLWIHTKSTGFNMWQVLFSAFTLKADQKRSSLEVVFDRGVPGKQDRLGCFHQRLLSCEQALITNEWPSNKQMDARMKSKSTFTFCLSGLVWIACDLLLLTYERSSSDVSCSRCGPFKLASLFSSQTAT